MAWKGERVRWSGSGVSSIVMPFIPNVRTQIVWSVAEYEEPQARIPAYATAQSGPRISHSTNSGHGTMVDFTVFIAMASLTACATPSSVKG